MLTMGGCRVGFDPRFSPRFSWLPADYGVLRPVDPHFTFPSSCGRLSVIVSMTQFRFTWEESPNEKLSRSA